MKKILKGIRKKEQGNKFVTKYNIHVITRKDIKQKMQKSVRSDVVIPNKLGQSETCQGLLRRFVYKNTNNNEISPHNDMIIKNVKNLFPYFPISFFPKKKLRRFRIKSGMTFMKQPAFTLAETLITLGIIGIVAAMTIPTLITNYQKKQTVTKLQKAISVLNQAYKLSFDDLGEPSAQEAYNMGSEQYFQTYWAPYIKTALMCTTYQQCGYKKAAPWILANNQEVTTGVVVPGRRATFYTSDGFLYVIFTAMGSLTSETGDEAFHNVIVDLNGAEGPNKFGRDVFYLTRVEKDGAGIQTLGMNGSDRVVNENCSSSGTGYYCAEKIRRAGWEIDKSYPWK